MRKLRIPLKQIGIVIIAVLGFTTNSFGQIEIINQNFNSSDEGWTTSDSWLRGNSSFANSDGNHWYITPNPNYANNMYETITSGTIDLSGYGLITLQVDIRYNVEDIWAGNYYDGINIEYYDGSTWAVLGAVGDGTNWYNALNVDALANDGWSSDNGAWQTASITLPNILEDNPSARFRVNFASDVSATDEGVAFDNFIITGYNLSNVISHDFNSGDNGWTASGSWTLGNGADSRTTGEDGNYWHTTPYNNYTDGMSGTVTSGTIDLSSKSNMLLQLAIAYQTRPEDGFNIEYSDDDGSSWNVLGDVGEGYNWYIDADIDGIGNNIAGWTGNNRTWIYASIQLPAALENNPTVKFRINFGSLNDGSTRDGACFDNFTINEYSVSPPTPAKTWYAYSSTGNWNEAGSWTLDGATNPLYVNPSAEVPAADDNVIIHSGKKIIIQSGTNNLELLSIEVNGELDVTSSIDHNFNVIKGNGTISMEGYNSGSGAKDNFPDGTATLFTDAEVGGSVKIYGTGIELNEIRTFNNVNINLTSGSAILLADYILNGNLTVTSGDFKINNTSNTTPLNITVNGNVTVTSDGSISVGTANAVDGTADNGYGNYHKYYHVFTVNGNFTNQGNVRLTNETSPDYNTRTTQGAVSLVFSGASNNTFSCENTTDLYYCVISKGIDQTYSLTVNATDTCYFSLYGDNNNSWDDTDIDNPENRKALWIKAGSLILEGYVTIPTLSEGGTDYSLGENAALVLNGSNVYVSSTAISANNGVHSAIDYTDLSYSSSSGLSDASGSQGIYVSGALIVNDGEFSTSYSHGVTYRGESEATKVEINGGIITTGQLKMSGSTNAANAKMSYIQTGGEFKVVDDLVSDAIFDLSAVLGSFIMSGGTISIEELSSGTTNAINIACDQSNINVTGGTIVIDNPSGTNATATISTTAPFHNFILRENQDNGVKLLSALQINNDLTLEEEDFNANNLDLSIGSDFTIEAGATYTTGTNTTVFNGTKVTNLNFTGTAPIFNNVTVAKTVDEKDFLIFYSDQDPAFQVNGEFRIEKGIFDYGTYTVQLNGNIYVADSIGKSTSTGNIHLKGSGAQVITSNHGVIQNMNIENSNGISLTEDLNIYGTLTLSDGIFDINTYKLTMFGSDANISGTFGVGEMIQTDGNASDGGLEMYLDANETLTFPIGTDANNGGSSTTRYTPAVATFSNFQDSGYINISLADNQIPMTIANGGDILSYYWKISHNQFDNVPTVVSYEFTHDASDEDGGNVSNFVCGLVLDEDPYSQDTDTDYNETTNKITFNDGFNLQLASYTAGAPNRFNGKPDIFYSRYTTTGPYDWNNKANWFKNTIGDVSNKVPVEGAIIIIRGSARMNVSNAGAFNDPGVVTFDHDYTTNPTPDSENVPRLQFLVSGTFNLGSVSGTGMISFNTGAAPSVPVVNGDFGKFGTNTDSYYLYFGSDATLNNIPTPIPNIMFESAAYTINQEVDVNGSLIAQLDATVIPMQNMNIDGDLLLGANDGCTFQLPSQATAIELNIEGNIDFTYDPYSVIGDRDLIVEPANSYNVEHKIILKGDIIHGSNNGHSIDLWYSNTRERAILELQGESDNTYSRTSSSVPQFYRIILNKGTDQTNSFSFNESFTLRGATNTTNDKALELLNGTLVLNNAGIDIDLTTGNPFTIPSSAALEVTLGTVNANGTDGGITLDGKLLINGGTVDLSSAANDDNYIEYGASGNATLEISGGTLDVGTQIRRLSSNSSGVLNYTQTGGDVTIGVNTGATGYDENRGMFEVVNAGSNFTYTGGTFTIVRQNGNTPHIAALYLDPDTYDISGSTITIGNNSTPNSQYDIRINSNIPLNNLTLFAPTLTNDPIVELDIRNLTIAGNLLINSEITFDGNGLDLIVQGNFTNDGTYTANNNTTTFSSNSAQQLSGSGTEDFYKFVKSSSGALALSKNITINNTLNIAQGTLNTNTFSVTTKGNVIHDGTITCTSGSGIIFNGDSKQYLSRSSVGQSTIGIMTINNSNDVQIIDNGHSFFITNSLRLQKGVFNIGGSLLELGSLAIIDPVESFSLTNMIQTNSSFQDNGIKKNFPQNHTTDFVFPVGQLVYTPITVNLSSPGNTIGTTAGSLIARPANEFHPTVKDGDDFFTVTNDTNNVLQYYWILRANNITGLYSDISFTYDMSDALTNASGYDSTNYIGARVLTNNNLTEKINKFKQPENVDEENFKVIFNFNGDSDNGITGDYFSGIDEAIPDNVATYTSAGSGNVTNTLTYVEDLPTDGVAPTGAVLIVSTNHEITFNVNNVTLYKTIIQPGGTLTIDGTERHRLGTVTGTGTLKITSNTNDISFPAGDYIDFFDCSGGSLEYSGTGNYGVLAGLSSLRDVVISGSGTKTMANNDVQVCENFTLNGPTFDNASDKSLTIQGDMDINSGEFKSGASSAISVDGTLNISGGTYSGETDGSDSFGALNISTGIFNVGSGGSISIQGDLSRSAGGTFTGGSGTSKIVMNGSSTQNISGTFTGVNEMHNLEINNISGLTLSDNVTIDNQLSLTNGLISPSATLLLNDGATIFPASGSASSYINGKLNKTIGPIDNDFIFPVGKSGQYRPTGVYDVTTDGLEWETEYFKAAPTTHVDVDNTTPTNSIAIKKVTDIEYWVITDNGSSNAKIGLSWGADSKVSADGTEREELKVMAWNGSTWDSYGGDFTASAGHTQSTGSFKSSTALSFSTNIITLGSGDINNPLPIELINFTATASSNTVELRWATASEKNNDYFDIERSVDGLHFETIATVNGAGNSFTRIDYSETDYNPIYGVSYYRIKQTDFDGKYSYTHTVSVLWNNNSGNLETGLNVYPNPFNSGDLILETKNIEPGMPINISIYDFNGKNIYTVNLINPENREINLIPMAMENISSGIYILSVVSGNDLSRTKLIVE